MPEAVVATDTSSCVCGHERDAHEHYRRGSECAACPPRGCPRFRRDRRPSALLRDLLVRLGRGPERRG